MMLTANVLSRSWEVSSFESALEGMWIATNEKPQDYGRITAISLLL